MDTLQPAEWLHRDHTVWGEVADLASLQLADRIARLPSNTPDGEGTMRFLDERLKLSVLSEADDDRALARDPQKTDDDTVPANGVHRSIQGDSHDTPTKHIGCYTPSAESAWPDPSVPRASLL